MITISTDEAYAFDYLSILETKCDILNSPNDSIEFLRNEMVNQIGIDLFNKIIKSKQYKLLYECNYELFLLIDKVRSGDDIQAITVDDMNMRRFYLKKDLQEAFFNNNLTEIKNG
jgi:hypothetical protein